MARKPDPQPSAPAPKRRRFTAEFRREAVQMMLDGHCAVSIAERLGLSSPTLLYRWKRQQLHQSGPVATSLDERVREREAELLRVQRDRTFKLEMELTAYDIVEAARTAIAE